MAEQQLLQGSDLYMNKVQALCQLVDANKLYAVWGRGTGKTAFVTTPRILTCAGEMPGETASLSHKSFVALFQNVIPTILATLNQEITLPDGTKRPMLREGLDYVVGQKDHALVQAFVSGIVAPEALDCIFDGLKFPRRALDLRPIVFIPGLKVTPAIFRRQRVFRDPVERVRAHGQADPWYRTVHHSVFT